MTWKTELAERIEGYLAAELEGSEDSIAASLATMAWAPERFEEFLDEFQSRKLSALDLYSALTSAAGRGLFLGPLLDNATLEAALRSTAPLVLRLAIPHAERERFDQQLRVDACLEPVLIDLLTGLASLLADGGSLELSCFLGDEQELPLLAIELDGVAKRKDPCAGQPVSSKDLLRLILESFDVDWPDDDWSAETYRFVLALPESIYQAC